MLNFAPCGYTTVTVAGMLMMWWVVTGCVDLVVCSDVVWSTFTHDHQHCTKLTASDCLSLTELGEKYYDEGLPRVDIP